MTAVTLRPAAVGDVPLLFEIRCSVRQNHQGPEELAALGISHDTVEEMIAGGTFFTCIAEVEGEAAGFVMVDVPARYVFACFVRPRFECRGVGRALMESAERHLLAFGATSAWLATGSNPALRAYGFYRHLGWSPDCLMPDGQIRFVKSWPCAAEPGQ